MKTFQMLKNICLTILFPLTFILSAQSQKIDNDLIELMKGEWKGSLTYLDYSSGKPYTIPADLFISFLPQSNYLVYRYTYPNEPKANGSDTISIDPGKKLLGKETIQSKRKLKGGNRLLITYLDGTDGNNNQPARIRYTYLIGPSLYSRKKEVRLKGERKWIKRNEFTAVRKS